MLGNGYLWIDWGEVNGRSDFWHLAYLNDMYLSSKQVAVVLNAKNVQYKLKQPFEAEIQQAWNNWPGNIYWIL
jgi:hypothetical protein